MMEEADDYFDQCIGACITKVQEGNQDVWFHLSDGSMIVITAEVPVGFSIEILPADEGNTCRPSR